MEVLITPMSLIEGNVWLILIAAISYLLGSLPTAHLVTKGIIGKDVWLAGSGNIGAMNSYRLIQKEKSTKIGIAGFALALVGDMGKGVLAIFIAKWLGFLGYDPLLALIIGSFFVVLGHNYSFFFKFKKGGRGMAALGGVVLALNPLALLIGLGTLVVSIFLIQYLLIARIHWGKFSDMFSAASSQIVGRVGGLVIALVPLYFFGPEVFLPTLAANILVLIKHIERVKVYIKGLANRQK